LKLTKDDFYKDSADQGMWFYKCGADFTEKRINEILQNQKLRELIEKEVDVDCDCEYGDCSHSMAERVLKESKK